MHDSAQNYNVNSETRERRRRICKAIEIDYKLRVEYSGVFAPRRKRVAYDLSGNQIHSSRSHGRTNCSDGDYNNTLRGAAKKRRKNKTCFRVHCHVIFDSRAPDRERQKQLFCVRAKTYSESPRCSGGIH